MTHPSETEGAQSLIAVRPGESFDIEGVQRFLQAQGIPLSDPICVQQFPAGASNLTYLLTSGIWQGVLRRPPLGPLPPRAHDMAREYRLLQHLHPVFPHAPKPHALCADGALIGSPFYVMEYRPGIVVDDAFPTGMEVTKDLLESISHAAVDTLVDLHRIDYEQAGLSALGHPQGFLARQVKGWTERYARAKTDDLPEVEHLTAWLVARLPPEGPATLIHNDFKLNNIIWDAHNPTKVTAVVDWEMATIGNPLLDLAVTLSYWIEDGDRVGLKQMLPTVTQLPGFTTRDEFIHRYALHSGRDVSDIGYYLVFAYFKLAVILQQIYDRWKKGQTSDERFAHFHVGVRNLVLHASELAHTI